MRKTANVQQNETEGNTEQGKSKRREEQDEEPNRFYSNKMEHRSNKDKNTRSEGTTKIPDTVRQAKIREGQD